MYRCSELRLDATSCRKKQAGAALLLIMLFLLTVSSFLFLDKLNSATSTTYQNEYQRVTAWALAEAKSALIGYALTYAETHPGSAIPPPYAQPQGFLPCPDQDGDGSQSTPCGSAGVSVIGWLPWEDLRLQPLRDGAGECLWYAVSGNYKNNPKVSLTSDTDGQFVVKDAGGNTVAGADPSGSDRAIAIVFAPGPPIDPPGPPPSQFRAPGSALGETQCASTDSAGAINQAVNYLETLSNGTVSINNSNGTEPASGSGLAAGASLPSNPSTFLSAPNVADTSRNPVINDTLVVITPRDFAPVYERMDRWVANRVRQCLTTSFSVPYFWAAALGGGGSTAPYSQDTGERFGRIPEAPNPTATDPDPNVGGVCFKDVGGGSGPGWWWWWDTWREMVFYAVDDASAPVAVGGTPPLRIGGTASQFLVVVAERKLAGQQRNTAADRANIANYLEDHNNPHFPSPPSPSLNGSGNIPTGDEQFLAGAATTTFNDTVCSDSVRCPP